MSANEIHVGDIGTQFIVTVKDGTSVVDISIASTINVIFQKPSGTSLTKTATFVTDGTDGQCKYISILGDLDEAGTWKMQAYISWSGGNSFHTDIQTFKVYRNL